MRSKTTPATLRTLALAATLACSALLPTVAVAGLLEGAMAYVAGDQAATLREFEPLALQGVPEAINGVKYLLDDGYAQAGYAWGKLIEAGKITNNSPEQAYSFYQKAADNGYATAQYEVGRLIESGKLYGDVESAYSWYSKAAYSVEEASAAQKRLAPTVAAIEKKRADDYAAAERKRAQEEAIAERKRAQEEAAAIKREQQRLAQWRKTLQIGDDTHCGPIIEVRRPMFKVALIAQIQGFGSESWLKEAELFTPEYGCRNVNGRLSTQ
jgi:hypothetical protein